MATPTYSTFRSGLTGDVLIDISTTGYKWNLTTDRTIDWSVSGGFGTEYWTNHIAVRNYFQAVMDDISYFANIKFQYVGNFSNPVIAAVAGSEINISMDGENRFFSADNQWAMAFFPSATSAGAYSGAPGDIYLNLRSAANSLSSYEPGSSGWALMIHELGHALGLKHPHDNGGDPGRPTMQDADLGDYDVDWVTVMSYDDAAPWNDLAWEPATLMMLDALALQYLYGKNMTTNAGDGVYTLTQTDLYQTLWDADGFDVIDLSKSNTGWVVEMPEWVYSTLIDTPVGLVVPINEVELEAPHTLYWLMGDYEGVQGSAYADLIIADSYGNVVLGGGGGDTIIGNSASDYLRGEEGNDSISGGDSFDDTHGNMGNDTVRGGDGDDWVVGGKDDDLLYGENGWDVVWGNLGNDTQYGDDGNDQVRGGQGDDVVHGGAGDDYVSGDRGNDTITGGTGADRFHGSQDLGIDRVLDFNRMEGDRVLLDPGTTYTVRQAGADTIIDMGGGHQMILVGVQHATLSDGWIVSAWA